LQFDSSWLGRAYFENPSLTVQLDSDGQVVSFGRTSALKQIQVYLDPARVTIEEFPEPSLLKEDWLEDWRHRLLQESRSTTKTRVCSFCEKSDHQVGKLIAGPSIYICNECVELCSEILSEERQIP
jgi:hypothetical protein